MATRATDFERAELSEGLEVPGFPPIGPGGVPVFGDQLRGGTCRRCREQFPILPEGDPEAICPECERIEAEGARILASKDQLVEAELIDAGLARRERMATLGGIPPSIRRAAAEPMRELIRGEIPAQGFGLIGTPGIGKSSAFGALLREFGGKRIEQLVAAGDFRRVRGWLVWLDWPEESARMRARSLKEDGHVAIDEDIRRWSAIEVLIIDDLGAERMRGAYLDDWATSQLDRVIGARDRACKPVWWTSNIGADALAQRYGSRFWSRLSGSAPEITLPSAEDLRRKRR